MNSQYNLGSACRFAILLAVNLFWATAAPAQDVATMPVRGPLNAPVSIMIFSDFGCAYCAKATATLSEIERLYPVDVMIIFKHYPLRSDESALLPHEAAMAAGQQGKFWLMHDLLFVRQGKHQRKALDADAKELHLNLSRFKKDMDQHGFRDAVMKDIAEAKALKVTATPTFFIDGYKLEGLQSLSALQQIIENRLRIKSAHKVENTSLQQFLQTAYRAKDSSVLGASQPTGDTTRPATELK
jgi:protein-disulfide isomerase